jgi:hypothetical protein
VDIGPLGKVLSVLKPLTEIVGSVSDDVKAAKADGSPGGRKVTVEEVSAIVADHLEDVAKVIVGIFVKPDGSVAGD